MNKWMFAGQLSCPLTNSTSITVAVKVLKDDMSSRSMRESFEREVKTISSFDHENILRLIGVVIIGKLLNVLTVQSRSVKNSKIRVCRHFTQTIFCNTMFV